MDLSKLNEIVSRPKEKILYLALKIEAEKIKSAFWTIEKEGIKIVAQGTEEEWGGGKGELVVACDASIASAVNSLSELAGNIPNRLILGLPNSWVQDGKIIRERAIDLKFLTEKLTLKPLGFLVNPEAIGFYLKNTEKDFTSAILIYLSAGEIVVTLIEDGRVKQTENVGRSDNLALDVEEGILRFKKTLNLPARILLYDGEDLEAAKQTLISYPWQPPIDDPDEKKPGFLHLPRVEILAKNFDIEAIAFAGAREITNGKEILPIVSGGEEKKKENEEERREPAAEKETIEEETKEEPMADQEPVEEDFPEEENNEIEFFKDRDILAEGSFPASEGPLSAVKESAVSETNLEEVDQTAVKPDLARVGFKKEGNGFLKKIFGKISGFFLQAKQSIFFRFSPKDSQKDFSYPSKINNGRWRFLPLLGLLLIVLFILAFYFFGKAEVTLVASESQVSQEFEFLVSSGDGVINLSEKILPGQLKSVRATGSKTGTVIGKKIVGDKAKGEVTIYNRTETPRTFGSGTVLVGPGKLRFVFDQEVRVASKSPDLVSGVDRWGEAKAQVTAAEIGAQYNVAPASQFEFENLSSSAFLAKNTVAFAGGTSRQIPVVSKEDQENLTAGLIRDLESQAKEKIQTEIGQGEIQVPETLISEIESKNFDHELQDEATSLNLDLTIKATVLTIKKQDLLSLAANLMSSEIEQKPGQVIDTEQSEVYLLKTVESGKKPLLLRGGAKIVLKPGLDSAELISKIRGKSFNFVQKTVLTFSGVKQSRIQISPGLFMFLSRLPFRGENISVKVVTEKDGQI